MLNNGIVADERTVYMQVTWKGGSFVVIMDADQYEKLNDKYSGTVKIHSGRHGMERYPALKVNNKVVALVGLLYGDTSKRYYRNGNKLDIRKENLEIVPTTQNVWSTLTDGSGEMLFLIQNNEIAQYKLDRDDAEKVKQMGTVYRDKAGQLRLSNNGRNVLSSILGIDLRGNLVFVNGDSQDLRRQNIQEVLTDA